MKICHICNRTIDKISENSSELSTYSIYKDTKDFFICDNCLGITNLVITTTPLDSTFNKLNIVSKGEVVSKPRKKIKGLLDQALAKLDLLDNIKNKQEDLLYVAFKLVHANTNNNRDTFLKEELFASKDTPLLKLINWNHTEPNIGVIYACEYVEGDQTEDDYLLCLGAIQKYRYPELAEQVMDRHENDNLYFSMEVWFKNAECSECHVAFESGKDNYCNHLKSRFETGSSVHRILKNLVFAGAGVVPNPADVDACSLAVAAQKDKEQVAEEIQKENSVPNKEENNLPDKIYTQEDVDNMVDKLVKEKVDAELEKANLLTIQDEYKRLAETNKSYEDKIKELSDALLSFEATQTKTLDKIQALETEKAELQSKLDKIEKEKIAANRMANLIELGCNVPANDSDIYPSFYQYIESMDDTTFNVMKILMVPQKNSQAQENKEEIKTEAKNKNFSKGQREETEELPIGGKSVEDKFQTTKETLLSIF